MQRGNLTATDRRKHTERGARMAALLVTGIRNMAGQLERGALPRSERSWIYDLPGGNEHQGRNTITSVPLTMRALSLLTSYPAASATFEQYVMYPMLDEMTLWRGMPQLTLAEVWRPETLHGAQADCDVQLALASGDPMHVRAAYKSTTAHIVAAEQVRRVLWHMQRFAIPSRASA